MSRLLIVLMVTALYLVACSGTTGSLNANAGDDYEITMGEQPRFDGCASTGNIENYQWKIISAPDTMSEDVGKVIRETEPNCAFSLDAEMGVDEIGVWEIQLEVRDGAGNKAADTVKVTVIE